MKMGNECLRGAFDTVTKPASWDDATWMAYLLNEGDE